MDLGKNEFNLNEQRMRDAIGRLETREPMTPMGEAGVATYEIFKGMVAGGFTERQALFIMGVTIAQGDVSSSE